MFSSRLKIFFKAFMALVLLIFVIKIPNRLTVSGLRNIFAWTVKITNIWFTFLFSGSKNVNTTGSESGQIE